MCLVCGVGCCYKKAAVSQEVAQQIVVQVWAELVWSVGLVAVARKSHSCAVGVMAVCVWGEELVVVVKTETGLWHGLCVFGVWGWLSLHETVVWGKVVQQIFVGQEVWAVQDAGSLIVVGYCQAII